MHRESRFELDKSTTTMEETRRIGTELRATSMNERYENKEKPSRRGKHWQEEKERVEWTSASLQTKLRSLGRKNAVT